MSKVKRFRTNPDAHYVMSNANIDQIVSKLDELIEAFNNHNHCKVCDKVIDGTYCNHCKKCKFFKKKVSR